MKDQRQEVIDELPVATRNALRALGPDPSLDVVLDAAEKVLGPGWGWMMSAPDQIVTIVMSRKIFAGREKLIRRSRDARVAALRIFAAAHERAATSGGPDAR